MKKIMIVFGTRPEAIKMCPLIIELKKRANFNVVLGVTGQHKEMVLSVLNIFNIKPDYNLKIMKKNQTLFDISYNVLRKAESMLLKEKPDIVIVHGDTTSAYIMALSCFYLKIPVAHVEAGLRTYNLNNPYPEEFNRKSISIISQYDFAPTEQAKENLLKEGKKSENIWVTGNTVIDSFRYTIKKDFTSKNLQWFKKLDKNKNSKLIFLTVHRRESIGKPMENIFKAVKKVLEEYDDVKIIYPVHKNPSVKKIAERYFNSEQNIHLVDFLDVVECHNIMLNSYLILTDSGGIQEEAAALHIPTVVLRDFTEREEGIKAGIIKLAGTETKSVYGAITEILNNKELYSKMKNSINPFGDGSACNKIADVLEKVL